ncbi:hypothetical protein [Saccharothrix sp. Mg75]|uniref:hypothetical protein n=1 Tax=Saccharothrix sp. Mg75 TaxID=3445357 RepID=UPI003EEEE234
MFEEDRPASPKKRFSSVALLAAGGAVVATVMATLASVLAGGDPQPAPPEPRAGVDESPGTYESVAPDGRTATVVVTVSTRVGAVKRGDAAAPKSGEPRTAPESVRTTAVTPGSPGAPETTSPPPSNPPSSFDPPSSAAPSSTTPTGTTTDAP